MPNKQNIDVDTPATRSGNPYAKIDGDTRQFSAKGQIELAFHTAKPVQSGIPTSDATLFSAPSGCPYWYIQNEDEAEKSVKNFFTERPQQSIFVSKEFFEKSCRRIFGQYIPHAEKQRLRPQHREFIARNVGASPEAREKILGELMRYDLASIPGINPQFNRERDPFTEAKLREIEDACKKH